MHGHDGGVCVCACLHGKSGRPPTINTAELNAQKFNFNIYDTLGDQCSTEMLISVCICAMQVFARVAPRMVLNRHFVAKNTSTSCHDFFSRRAATRRYWESRTCECIIHSCWRKERMRGFSPRQYWPARQPVLDDDLSLVMHRPSDDDKNALRKVRTP